MTVVQVDRGAIHYIFESGDTLPYISPNQGAGSTAYESDTGRKLIWNGESWVDDLSLIYAIQQATV